MLLAFFLVNLSALPLSAQDTQSEEVVFKSGDLVINGTLVLPDSAVNVPVLIFIGGSYEWGELHPQREVFIRQNLEAVFPDQGIGILYYDPRGIGDSDGRWGRASLTDFAEDAIAAINYLQQRKEIDATRIGIIGLGEAGWVAQIVAATAPQDVKIMASLGGPIIDPNEQLINEYHSSYVCNGQDSTSAYDKAAQKAQSHLNWVNMLPITKRWRHMKMKLGFEPAEYIQELQIPSLFLFGSNDGQVYPSWSIDELNRIFPDTLPQNFEVHTIIGANHFFHVVPPCYKYPDDESSNIKKDFSFRFRELLQNFVFGNL